MEPFNFIDLDSELTDIMISKDENSDKLLIKRLLNGFKFWEYFNTISKVAGKNNVKVFLYEKIYQILLFLQKQ